MNDLYSDLREMGVDRVLGVGNWDMNYLARIDLTS